jgi:hypothetical protein
VTEWAQPTDVLWGEVRVFHPIAADWFLSQGWGYEHHVRIPIPDKFNVFRVADFVVYDDSGKIYLVECKANMDNVRGAIQQAQAYRRLFCAQRGLSCEDVHLALAVPDDQAKAVSASDVRIFAIHAPLYTVMRPPAPEVSLPSVDPSRNRVNYKATPLGKQVASVAAIATKNYPSWYDFVPHGSIVVTIDRLPLFTLIETHEHPQESE